MLSTISTILQASFPKELVEKMLECFSDMKRNYYLGNYRDSARDAGSFLEVALRIIQFLIDGGYTRLDDTLPKFHAEVLRFERSPAAPLGKKSDTIRIFIPRTLDIVHDIRNQRDVDHPKGELNANYTDATLCYFSASWILVEMLRVYHTLDIDEAQRMIDEIMDVPIPVIQDIDGFLKTLDPDLTLEEKVLLFTFKKRDEGVSLDEIMGWTHNAHRKNNVSARLKEIEQKKTFIHKKANEKYYITDSGIREITRRKLIK